MRLEYDQKMIGDSKRGETERKRASGYDAFVWSFKTERS